MTRIVFGIISALQKPATVAQLVSTLGGRQVVVHHDFQQRPNFSLDAPNVRMVPNPALTGWGTWGYCEAIVRTIEECLANVDFDYFQLLSPTCLPLRPIDEFEAKLAESSDDGNIDLMPLQLDPNVTMTFGWRYLAGRGSLRLAALRRARNWYFEPGAHTAHRSSLSVLQRLAAPASGELRARLALTATRLAIDGWGGPTVFDDRFRPFVGSCWFGANRKLCEHIVAAARDARMQRFFENLPNVDESFFPSVMGNAGMRLGPSNHVVNQFNDNGNPHWFRPGDLGRLVDSGAFFGRKFPDDPNAQIRLELIDRVRQKVSGGVLPMEWRTVSRARRGPRLAFGVMSTTVPPATVAQLVQALAPHPVTIHHDPVQQPGFHLEMPNLRYVANPQRTVVTGWSWTAATLRLIRHALQNEEFDYFQLLSPWCLPIRPIEQFAAHVARSGVDAHADLLPIGDVDTLMAFGAGLYASVDTWPRRVLEQARDVWLGPRPEVCERNGVVLSRRAPADEPTLAQRTALAVSRLAQRSSLGMVMPDPRTRFFAGGPWFGASREVCEHLVVRSAVPEWLDYFESTDAPSWIAIPTLLGMSGFRIDAGNHLHSTYDGSDGRWLTAADLRGAEAAKRFFARKFSDHHASALRLQVLAAVADEPAPEYAGSTVA